MSASLSILCTLPHCLTALRTLGSGVKAGWITDKRGEMENSQKREEKKAEKEKRTTVPVAALAIGLRGSSPSPSFCSSPSRIFV